jgi:phosphatidylinositol alpha-mannosyltransferase
VYASPATGGESQGIVLLEAMAQGVPVVASDIAGYRTVITNGSDGLLVRPSDPIALAHGVVRVLGDPTLAGGLSASARAAVERTYDWRVVIPRHITAYRNASLAASAETAVA